MKTIIPCIPMRSPRGILLRHAQKEVSAKGSWGNEVALTAQGRKDCLVLRKVLNVHPWQIESSPVKRCVETAALLSNTADASAIKTTTLLGAPTILIENTALVEGYFFAYSPLQIAERLRYCSRNPAGFCRSTANAVCYLMRHMIATLHSGDTNAITLFVTHDLLLALVVGHFFPYLSLKKLWPDYLEGLFFWREGDYMVLNYREYTCTFLC